ncbi:MAG TPA: sigma-70 family RNA polymerase sigma factor [Ignavibacteriaceae bacterium]|nr:sigma-70 family RNA polymerase sigma factor [Ignavibacteriaceae bacterium]
MPEEIQLNKLKSGDFKSFKALVDEHQKKVLNTCNRFVNNREDAEDLTQEVFIEVYRSLSNFRGDSKISTWIYRIAVTKSLDYLRKKKRKKRFGTLKNIFSEENPAIQVKSSESSNPDTNLENEDRIRILNEALGSLPENQRTVFTLSKYDEMSYAEIAEIMDTSLSSVESLIHRAKVNLKKKLTQYYKKKLI